MPRRGENIRKRKDGRWEGRYICERTPDGKAKYRSIYAHSYTEVKKQLTAIQANRKEAQPRFSRTVLFGEASRQWIAARDLKLKHSTIVKYDEQLRKHILPVFSNTSLILLSDESIAAFLKQKSERLSASSVHTLLTIIKAVMRYSAKQGWCTNTFSDLRLPAITEHEVTVLSNADRARLIAFVLKDMDNIKLGIYLTLFTGIRVGELCALKWEHIDFSAQTMHIEGTIQRIKNPNNQASTKTVVMLTQPKTKSSIRDIPLPLELLTVLSSFRRRSDCYLLTGTDKPTEPRTVQYYFKKYAKLLRLPHSNPHILRHTFATYCIELGFDVKTLSEILGHSSVEITLNRYVHSSPERKRSQMALLFAVNGQNSGQENAAAL